MCGIAGILGSPDDRSFPLVALRHRGPDEEGIWRDPQDRIWLGHRRLSILDLTPRGRQPMEYGEGRYRIVFNGEIYNFIELRQELESKGYIFQSDSDTEVIPAAYDCWGVDCLHRFNGMWALAIWDAQKKELWLARDRFGKKPLYYYCKDGLFAFASEVQALQRWLGPQADLDAEVVQSICAGRFEWQGTERTYLTQVRTLPAGYWMRVERGRPELKRWYGLEPYRWKVPETFVEQALALRELLIDACRLRLRSDVPLATCLSGGLDSSSITAIVHRGLRRPEERAARDCHRAFCASFPNTMLDETDGVRAFAETVEAQLRVYEIKPPTEEKLLEAISACDGPMHALAFYPIWELYGFIRENGVKVTLDGQGPDEMMGGYFETIQSALGAALFHGRLGWFWDIYKTYSAQGESSYRSSKGFAKSELFRLFKSPLSRLKRLIVSGFANGPTHSEDPLEYAQPTPPGLSVFSAELYNQFCQKQLPTILQQYDRCSMSQGVECRMPFMDYRIVEFVFSLPDTSLVGGGFTKRILREAVRGLVPEATRLSKVKIGFNAPIVEWFLGPMRPIVLDVMSSAEFRQSRFFEGPELIKKFEAWLKAPNWGEAWAFWPPVHLILWQRQMKSALARSQDDRTAVHG